MVASHWFTFLSGDFFTNISICLNPGFLLINFYLSSLNPIGANLHHKHTLFTCSNPPRARTSEIRVQHWLQNISVNISTDIIIHSETDLVVR